MELEVLFKYLLWIVFFGIFLIGVYFLFKRLGVLG